MKSGFSLVELLVAMAIGSMSCLALMQMAAVQTKVQAKIKDKLDLIQLRTSIHNRVDCPATRATCGTKQPQLLSLKGSFNLAFKEGKRQLSVEPYCVNGDVFVNYAYVKNGARALDPLTGRVMAARPLFPGPLCANRQVVQHDCPFGWTKKGYDFDTKRYVCDPSL